MKTRILAIFFGLWIWVTGYGQSLFGTFTNYSIKEGLSQSTVTTIYQDHNGFIWLGTSDGINRFDGQKFITYKYNYKDPKSISDNWILAILTEDSNNNLWILTADWVLNKFNQRTQEFIKYPFGNLKKGKSLQNIYSVTEDKNNNLWISSNLGIYKYDTKNGEMKSYCPISISDSANNKIPIISYIDSRGELWFSSIDALCRYDATNDTFKHYATGTKTLLPGKIIKLITTNDKKTWVLTQGGLNLYNPQKDNFITYPVNNNISMDKYYFRFQATNADSKGNIWIGTNNGLIKFDNKTHVYNQFSYDPKSKGSISNNEITNFFEDTQGNIWIGTINGLNKYIPTTNHFINFYSLDNKNLIRDIFELKNNEIFAMIGGNDHDGMLAKKVNMSTNTLESPISSSCDPKNISNSILQSYYKDKEGNLWLGTFGTGVFKYVPHSKRFNHILVDPGNPSSSRNSIWGFTEDKDMNIWFAMYNSGLGKFDPVNMKITQFYSIDKGTFKPFSAATMAAGEGDIIWIASNGAGLIQFNTKTAQAIYFTNKPKDKNSLASNQLRSIYIDKTGNIWLATANAGIDKFEPKTLKFTHFNNNENNKNYISSNSTWAVTGDKFGNIWFAVDGSIDCYMPNINKFIYYPSKVDASTGLVTDKALCMLSDSLGNVWFGTSGGGLSKYDYKTKTFSHYTETEGLSNNVIYGITQDNEGNLWLSTNKGISRFNPNTNSFTNYRESAGLQSDEFNQGAYLKSSTGQMYFGGINGFNVFEPENFKLDTLVSKTTIVSFYIADKKINVRTSDNSQTSAPDSVSNLVKDSTQYYLTINIPFAKKLVLPYTAKIFSLQFAAPAYNSAEKPLYRFKLENFDDTWHIADESNMATFTNLSPGIYKFKVAAANSDGYWNTTPTELIIEITPPWWKTWWFITLETILLISIIVIFIKFRERNLKHSKAKLEDKVKQRTKQIEEINEELRLRNYEIYRQKEEIAQQALQLKSELNLQNKVSEMALLKAQINPHFLFNTLNNIYSLVYQKSDDAPSAVMRLSELMRYMVYDANSEKVLIEKEINYLKSFVELQVLRLKNKDFVKFDIEGNYAGKTIAPMLLIPFVENAFKHGNKKNENPGIIINLVIKDDNLQFDVLNYYQQNGSINKDKTGGIGISNVKRRLELLHPGNHLLNITSTEMQYNVHLEISLQ